MTTIDSSIDSTSIAALNASTKATGKGTLDQTDFLKLLTTQLQTQDPFAPMDTTSMMAQMSQMTNNAGIAEMNASLKSILAQVGGGSSSAASWIGKSALVEDTSVNRDTGGNYRGYVSLAKAADSVTVDLLDSSGQVVHTDTMSNVAAGDTAFSWDGNGANGAASGPLKIRVTAKSGTTDVATTTSVWTPITAVQTPAGGAAQRLVTPNGLIAPDSALRLG